MAFPDHAYFLKPCHRSLRMIADGSILQTPVHVIFLCQLGPHNTTTTAPEDVEALSTSRDPVDNAPVPRSNSSTRKRSHDSSLSDEESGADSEGTGVELTGALKSSQEAKVEGRSSRRGS